MAVPSAFRIRALLTFLLLGFGLPILPVQASDFRCILAGGTRTQFLGFHFNLESLVPYCDLEHSTFLYTDGIEDACALWAQGIEPKPNTRRWNSTTQSFDFFFAFPGLDVERARRDAEYCEHAVQSGRYLPSLQASLKKALPRILPSAPQDLQTPVLLSWSTHGRKDGSLLLAEGALTPEQLHHELLRLRTALPESTPLILVTGACYSGKLAREFFDLPNSCAWFEVDEYEQNYGDENDLHVQLKNGNLDSDHDGKLSLSELNLTAQTEPLRTSDFFAKQWLSAHEFLEDASMARVRPMDFFWSQTLKTQTDELEALLATWSNESRVAFYLWTDQPFSEIEESLAQSKTDRDSNRRARAQWIKGLRHLWMIKSILGMQALEDHVALEKLRAFMECENQGRFTLTGN